MTACLLDKFSPKAAAVFKSALTNGNSLASEAEVTSRLTALTGRER